MICPSFKNGLENEFAVLCYTSFCSIYQLPTMPQSYDILYPQLQRYIIYRLNLLGGTHGTVRSDIATIEQYFAINGFHSDVRSWKPMLTLLNAVRKEFPVKRRTKRAFRASELSVMMHVLSKASINGLIVRCLIAFAFGGALRASEYTTPVKEPSINQSINIVREGRIAFFQDADDRPAIVYFFFRSKTNRIYKTEFAVMPCMCDLDLPCAIHELLLLRKYITNLKGNTYLFTWSDGSLVTYSDTLACFKKASAIIGANAKDIGTHSARKARIVIGVKNGLPAHVLLLLGRWKQMDSIKPYLAMQPLDIYETIVNNQKRNNRSKL
jgi:hypothetical protein